MELDLRADWLSVAAASAAMAIALAFSAKRYWSTPKRGWRVFATEFPRLLAIAMLGFTLFQPEITTRVERELRPEVVVLADDSASMDTEDVVVKGGGGDVAVEKRRDWLEKHLSSPLLSSLKSKYKVSVEHFSQPPGEDGTVKLDGTDFSYALSTLLASYKNLRAVILISDGDWNMGPPPLAAAVRLRSNGVKAYCVRVGSPKWLPDVELTGVAPPTFCLANERVSIPYEVRCRMPKPVKINITLSSAAGILETKEEQLSPGETLRGSFLWKPPAEGGSRMLSINIPVLEGEVLKTNNTTTFSIDVKKEALKTLVIDSLPRWEYRYLRNALERDPGVDNRSILFLPGLKLGGGKHYLKKFPSKEDLSAFDVVFVGDVGIGEGELTREDAALIEGLVKLQGSGVVFLPGRRGRQASLMDTPLGDIYPVELDPAHPKGLASGIESKVELTGKGRTHFLLTLADNPSMNGRLWRSLPGFFWSAAVMRGRPGAEVLAVHPGMKSANGRMPIIVTREYGNGVALFMGIDSAWRWRRGVEDKYHYRFWGQVARWMAHKRHLAGNRGVRCFITPENPVAGRPVTINATLIDRSGFPIDNAVVKATATPVGNNRGMPVSLQLHQNEKGWGLYSGMFTPSASGRWKLELRSANGANSISMTLDVLEKRLEVVGRPARSTTLQRIANVTKGAFFTAAGFDDAVNGVAALPERSAIIKRFQIWSQWWWGTIILALLVVHWILRKTSGLI